MADPDVGSNTCWRTFPRLAVDPQGGVAVASSVQAGGNPYAIVSRYRSDGVLAWQAQLPGFGPDKRECPGEVAFAPDGGVVVAGYVLDGLGPVQYELFVAKWDQQGVLRWVRRLGLPWRYFMLADQAVGADGSVVALLQAAEPDRWVTFKVSAVGGYEWVRELPSLADFSHSGAGKVRIGLAGDVTVAVNVQRREGDDDIAVVTYDQSGSVVNEVNLDWGVSDGVVALEPAPGGDLVLVGRQIGQSNTVADSQCLLARLDPLGEPRWTAMHTVPNTDRAPDLCIAMGAAVDRDGSVVFVGTQPIFDQWVEWKPGILAVRYNGDGEQIWSLPPASAKIEPREVAIDPVGAIIIGGYFSLDGGNGLALLKLTAAGEGVWVANPFVERGDLALGDMGMRPDGSVAVISVVQGSVNRDLHLFAVDRDGETLWSAREGSSFSSEQVAGPGALALDGAGGAVVAGRSFQRGREGWRLTRLDGGGHTLWERSSTAEDAATAPAGVALDDQGVTTFGTFDGAGAARALRLQKLDPSGVTTWRSEALPISDHGPVVLQPLAQGGLWVAGTVDGGNGLVARRYDSAGQMSCAWQEDFYSVRGETLVAARPVSGGGLVVTSQVNGIWELTVRLDAGGTKLWHTVTRDNLGLAVKSADVVATPAGTTTTVGSYGTWPYVQKLDDKGTRLWRRVETKLLQEPEEVLAEGAFTSLAVAPDGGVIASGRGTRVGGVRVLVTAKYSANRGASAGPGASSTPCQSSPGARVAARRCERDGDRDGCGDRLGGPERGGGQGLQYRRERAVDGPVARRRRGGLVSAEGSRGRSAGRVGGGGRLGRGAGARGGGRPPADLLDGTSAQAPGPGIDHLSAVTRQGHARRRAPLWRGRPRPRSIFSAGGGQGRQECLPHNHGPEQAEARAGKSACPTGGCSSRVGTRADR